METHLGISECRPEVVEQVGDVIVDERRRRPCQLAQDKDRRIASRFDAFAYQRSLESASMLKKTADETELTL